MLVFRAVGREKVIESGVGGSAVKVIGIDDGEGSVHHTLTAGNSMPRSPGLNATFRHAVAFRKTVQLLVDILHVKVLFHPSADGGLEILFNLMLDDEGHLAEACPVGIIQGEVNNRMTEWVYRHDLFQAAETASHAGGKND